jgi:hypothetical protein
MHAKWLKKTPDMPIHDTFGIIFINDDNFEVIWHRL